MVSPFYMRGAVFNQMRLVRNLPSRQVATRKGGGAFAAGCFTGGLGGRSSLRIKHAERK